MPERLPAAGAQPDLLLREVRVGGAPSSDPVDVWISGGRVAAIGAGLAPAAAESVAGDGRYLVPGLWDEHVHVSQWALAAERLPLGGARSAAEAAALVRGALAAGVPQTGRPLVGSGFRDGVWPDAPTRALLDAAAGERPVVLQSHDIHAVWLNAAGARWAGVEVPDSGLLHEERAFAVGRLVNAVPDAVLDAAVVRALGAAAELGVVGVVDMEMAWNAEVWRRRAERGHDAVRIEAAIYPEHLDRAEAEGLRTGTVLDANGLVTVGPLKALIDGALNTRGAYCADPYPDGSTGVLTVAREELTGLLLRAARLGLHPAIHAIGDAAIGVLLDAFAASGRGGRIEHAQLVADADLARFRQLDVTASVQPAHLLDDREVAEHHWAGRTARAFPYAALLAAGATLAFGSDAPVAPLDPWLAIRAALERSVQGEAPWHPEQCIPFAAALAASTRARGVVRVGDVADLALLDDEPATHSGAVAATLLGGRFTHRAV